LESAVPVSGSLGFGLAVVVDDVVVVVLVDVVELTIELEVVGGADEDATVEGVGVGVGLGELLVVLGLFEPPLQATASAATSAATTAVAACLARMHVPFTSGRRSAAGPAAGRGVAVATVATDGGDPSPPAWSARSAVVRITRPG